MSQIEFWFDFASPYSYATAMSIEDQAAARGLTVRWRPVTLGPIFADLGWNDSPFNLQPAKRRYMWMDVARTCRAEGLAFHPPDPFPPNSVLAARIGLVAVSDGWGPAYCRGIFHAAFAERADIADPATLARVVAAAGGPADAPGRALAAGNRPRLRAAVEEARSRGIFGAPTFFRGDEMFWGHDRLDQALDRDGTPRRHLG